MSPHDEDDAGPDQGVLNDEGVEKRRALVQDVAEDVVVVLGAVVKDPPGLRDPISNDVTTSVDVSSTMLQKNEKWE